MSRKTIVDISKATGFSKSTISKALNNSKEIKADNVICNADPPAVYSKLIQSKNTNLIFNWKIKRMEYSMGLFVYYFGTKKTYDTVEHHTIKFGDKYKEHLDLSLIHI